MTKQNTRPVRARTRVMYITLSGMFLVGLALVAALHGGVASASVSPPTASKQANPNAMCWQVVPSPNMGAFDNSLSKAAAVSANDVWAVGTYVYTSFQTLIEHWDDSVWGIVPSPNPGTGNNSLHGVAALSANDVWAVGWYFSGGDPQTLTEHWNGSTWSVVPSPNPDMGGELYGVAAVSANDVWAVGSTVIEHWDGSTWSTVPHPSPGTAYNVLFAVAAVSANDVWAVGNYDSNGIPAQTLIEHWNGSTWSVVPSPSPGTGGNALYEVGAVSANNVWAVGDYYKTGSPTQTLTEHWDGSTWSVVPSPNVGLYDNFLNGVAAVSANDVWAVGYDTSNVYTSKTLTEHWDGNAWSVMSSPSPGTGANLGLNGVVAVSANDVWAVGSYRNNDRIIQTLVEQYSVPCSIATPTTTSIPSTTTATPTITTIRSASPATTTPALSMTPSATHPVLSATASPRTDTPTSTATSSATPTSLWATYTPTALSSPTSCSIQFYDAPPGSTFYAFIRCLACLGIVNGYPDGTFRPDNHVTRGQLSKIVSNSAGFNDPQPNQMFQDVLVGSTFQVFIGRLASRGYINGYPCGGPGEPCSPTNLPYFRPNSNATRGQISKIDANAAGFNDPPGGQQFQDVPVGSTFYTYTYRLASRDVMQGYPCGGPGEPCVPPANLPYFRPGNNATRGQTSKIVGNTFFPNCNMQAR